MEITQQIRDVAAGSGVSVDRARRDGMSEKSAEFLARASEVDRPEAARD